MSKPGQNKRSLNYEHTCAVSSEVTGMFIDNVREGEIPYFFLMVWYIEGRTVQQNGTVTLLPVKS